jgi:hypothetical protein
MNIVDVGAELIQRGWDQGSLLSAKSAIRASLTLVVNEARTETANLSNDQGSLITWLLRQEAFGENDYLVVVTHPCDMKIPPHIEPHVEVIRAYWTSDRDIIYGAGKNNSLRRFLLRRRIKEDGKLEGLIADATIRVNIQKQDLLMIPHQTCFDEDDKSSLFLFRQWLGARYYRPTLPDDLVEGIARPIIKAIDGIPSTHNYQSVFDGIGKIFFQLQDKKVPFQVELLFEPDERKGATKVTKDDVAPIVSWLDEALQKVGKAKVAYWELIDKRAISAFDYAALYEISLGYLSNIE